MQWIRHGFHDGAAGRRSTTRGTDAKGKETATPRAAHARAFSFSSASRAHAPAAGHGCRTGTRGSPRREGGPRQHGNSPPRQSSARVRWELGCNGSNARNRNGIKKQRRGKGEKRERFSLSFPIIYLPVLLFRNAGSRSLSPRPSFVPEWGASVQPFMINGYVATHCILYGDIGEAMNVCTPLRQTAADRHQSTKTSLGSKSGKVKDVATN
jgi:hypothetical protein